MASEKAQNVHELLYEYLLTLKIDAQQYQKHSNTPLGADIFSLPNKGAFFYITYFLFDKFDHVQCKKEFEFLWPPLNKKNKSDFLKVAFNWLTNVANKNPEARMPKFTMSSFMTSSGDKLCLLYLKFAMFILQRSLKCKNVKYLNYPSLSSETKSAAFVVHSAMCENLLLQQDNLETYTNEVHQAFTDCTSVLTCRNRELKNNIKTLKSSLAEINTQLCEKFSKEDIADAEKQLDDENNVLLKSVRTSWLKMEEHYLALLPMKKILLVDFRSSNKILDGNNCSINKSASLVSVLRTQPEKGNLLSVQEGGRLNWEKLVELFSVILSTFDQPLKEMEAVLNINEILPQQQLMKKETEKILKNVDEIETSVIPSFDKNISEQEKYLSTFNVKQKQFSIDGRNYFLQQATPELKSRLGINEQLNDSAYSVLMNVSATNWMERRDSDNVFSNIEKATDSVESLPQQTATKRRSHTNSKQGGIQIEDLFFGTSFSTPNTSYSPSITSRDSLNFSLLDNQTLPDYPEFDITSELDASNLLLELTN